jgi:hypothetical protein
MNNHEIYFIKSDSNIINSLVLRFINNKIKIIDPTDFNTKIKIKKNINQKSKKGIKILNFLGYNTDKTHNIILHCIHYKQSCLFNKKICESLIIINSYQDFEEFNKNMMIYKYHIQNKFTYKYDCTMQSIESNI